MDWNKFLVDLQPTVTAIATALLSAFGTWALYQFGRLTNHQADSAKAEAALSTFNTIKEKAQTVVKAVNQEFSDIPPAERKTLAQDRLDLIVTLPAATKDMKDVAIEAGVAQEKKVNDLIVTSLQPDIHDIQADSE